MALTKERKEEIIDSLISNEGVEAPGPWAEEDRKALNMIPDTKLEALDKQRELAATAVENVDEDDATQNTDKAPPGKKRVRMEKDLGGDDDKETVDKPGKKAPAKNALAEIPAEVEDQIVQNWLKRVGVTASPKEAGSALNRQITFERQQRDSLISRITKNEKNKFTKDYLKSKDIEELEGMVALMATNEEDERRTPILMPNYAGAVPGLVGNLSEDFSKEDMDMAPEDMDWAGAGKK